MKAGQREQFSELLADVLGFYGQTVSPFAMSVWWAACERYELEQVSKALTAHALDPDRGVFAPKPADLVRHLDGSFADRSLIAWGKLLDAMQRVGAYESVVFDDGAIHAAVGDMGGWATVCRSRSDDLPFTQKRFCDLHRAYSQRPNMAYPARLVGDHEQSNRAHGHPVAPPVITSASQMLGLVGRLTKEDR